MPDYEPFQALQYENGGEICVITGPAKQPRQEEDERIFHVASDLILPNGCPVICHGLTSASHLNGVCVLLVLRFQGAVFQLRNTNR